MQSELLTPALNRPEVKPSNLDGLDEGRQTGFLSKNFIIRRLKVHLNTELQIIFGGQTLGEA